MRTIRLISALVLVAFGVSPPPATRVAAQAQEEGQRLTARTAARANSVYIVQMIDPPAGSYVGGVAGFPATKAPRGAKLDPNSPAVVGYGAFLQAQHDRALGRSGGRKVYDYRFSFNGFAAELTDAQANDLRSAPGVLAVTKDELVTADTVSTPAFLGLSDSGGLWHQLGGIGAAGENMMIGVIDSGIFPENPSFTDRTGINGNGSQGGKLSYQQIPGWHGKCTPGEAFPASKCSQKLIGAQRFNEAWGGDAGLKTQRPWEFASPRDYNSHGSHTASTATGNSGVKVPGLTGSISGMAPRARIAVYKALWSTEGAGHVRPNGAADPGLVYEHGVNDWLAFLCGTTAGVDPALCTALAGAGYSLDPSNLNGASIAIGSLLGSQTVRRTVTNVSDSAATYNASVTPMAGMTTVVTPSSLTIGAGQSATFLR